MGDGKMEMGEDKVDNSFPFSLFSSLLFTRHQSPITYYTCTDAGPNSSKKIAP